MMPACSGGTRLAFAKVLAVKALCLQLHAALCFRAVSRPCGSVALCAAMPKCWMQRYQPLLSQQAVLTWQSAFTKKGYVCAAASAWLQSGSGMQKRGAAYKC
ncbi:hypothetical protein NPIL_575321 [Nephila pilipes]|uniref:Secreted protein n=1 Tax=Nephila pilipes TaxID=299642 RepID=A0A8X6PIF8_NEPPI|nr:hypothetical protein NPIL_575321 [Nephila pilipes]